MLDRENLISEKQRLKRIVEPKTFKYLPLTYIIRTPEPLSFLPSKLVKHFNDRVYFNYLHRECFNACIDAKDDNQCYKNCQSKHLTAIQLFKTAVEEKRNWDPFNSYFNLREYQKRPRYMGKNIPSDADYIKKLRWLQQAYKDEVAHKTTGLEDVFDPLKELTPSKTNIFRMYLEGKFPSYTQKAIDRNNLKGRYKEYLKLNEELGDRIDEYVNSTENDFTWGHVTGEDFEGTD